jgi:hypothetical protein
MTETSQQFSVFQEKSELSVRPHTSSQAATILKTAAALLFACAMGLAPMPAFAQHGGGAGGGGAHGGGGGSRGGPGGGGSASASTAGASAANNSGGSGNHSNSTTNSSGGHWWNPFHGGSGSSAAPAKGSNGVPAGNIKSESSATSNSGRFAAGNDTWQEPPSASAQAAARVNYYGPANVNASRPFVPLSSTTRGSVSSARSTAMIASAQHPYQPVRPGSPYYPYYPYYGYSPYYGGLGFGFGGFGPCDPFWGCYGYGFGYGVGYGFGGGFGYFGGVGGFGGGSSYGPGWTDASSEGSGNVTDPNNPNSYVVAVPGTGSTQAAGASVSDSTRAAKGDAAQQPTYVLLYLKDGTSFAVSDYWLTNGKLHYVTSYGGDNSVDESQVDLQRTVNENAARGVDFSLRPQPATAGDGATTVLRENSEPPKPEPQKP